MLRLAGGGLSGESGDDDGPADSGKRSTGFGGSGIQSTLSWIDTRLMMRGILAEEGIELLEMETNLVKNELEALVTSR
jgi:hypothetical protein